jgi:hypothetical protein
MNRIKELVLIALTLTPFLAKSQIKSEFEKALECDEEIIDKRGMVMSPFVCVIINKDSDRKCIFYKTKS